MAQTQEPTIVFSVHESSFTAAETVYKRISFLFIMGELSQYTDGLHLDGRFRFPAGTRDFSFLHSIQTGTEIHPASYPMVTGGSFPERKAAGALS
jgi:hypothetical protein